MEVDLATTEEELELLLFTKEEEEFMVVPELENSPIRLEDLLSEASFSALMVDPVQNPSGVFVVDVEKASSNYSAVGGGVCNGSFISGVWDQQFQNYQHFSYASDNVSSFKAFDGAQSKNSSAPQTSRQSELSDPTASWVAQATDVTLLERLVSESDRFRSVDDILDIVPHVSAVQPTDFHAVHGSTVLDQQQILDEIVREAEEISSRNGSPATFTPEVTGNGLSLDSADLWERVSNSSSSFSSGTDSDSMDSYQPPQFGKEPKKAKSKRAGDRPREVGKPAKREGARAKKRDQNREAALRYRLKKRAERSATSEELSGLIERNEVLKGQKANIASEIAYLKGLLSEVHKKTGLKRLY